MTTKVLLTAAAIGLAAALSAPGDASAAGKKPQKRPPAAEARDCTPFNGPFGYYGNPWCDGGYKFAEDYPPGTGRYFDVFDLPAGHAASPAAGTDASSSPATAESTSPLFCHAPLRSRCS